VGVIYKQEGERAFLDPEGKIVIGDVTGAYLLADGIGATFSVETGIVRRAPRQSSLKLYVLKPSPISQQTSTKPESRTEL
jgi:hypothetical protein